MGKILAVTGIDTGIGKTYVTGRLAKRFREQGRRAITVKLVQTGNTGYSEDIEKHRALMGGGRFPEDLDFTTAPQIFAYPGSAELAARLEGKTVDVKRIVRSVNTCAERYDVVLAETAGGLMVPLTSDFLMIDLIVREKWPVILVTNGRLGSLNHTLLSLEAMIRRGITVEKVVYDWSPDVPPEIDRDTPYQIAAWLNRQGLFVPIESLPRL